MNNLISKDFNNRIVKRKQCFYWQTDRDVSVAEIASVWVDRSSGIEQLNIIDTANKHLNKKLTWVDVLDKNSEFYEGSVNTIRMAKFEDGQDCIIRCHPVGVANGYFYVESLAAQKAKEVGVPSYSTYLIYDKKHKNDCSFQVIERLPGNVTSKYIINHPECEQNLIVNIGKIYRKLHENVKVQGFGMFDNKLAKSGILQGLHKTQYDAICAGLDENLQLMLETKTITKKQKENIRALFFAENKFLQCTNPSLVHNDLALWNCLTNGKTITGVADWDECVGGDPVLDLACWSLFEPSYKLEWLLAGYFAGHKKERTAEFEEKFWLFRLRYVITKMALRLKRFNYEKSDFIKKLLKVGKDHLKECLKYFNI